MEINKKILAAVAAIAVIVVAAFSLLGGTNKAQEAAKHEMKIGLILPGDKGVEGWNALQYAGASKAAAAHGLKIAVRDKIDEKSGDIDGAIKSLVAEGAQLIFLASYNYPDRALNAVKANKQVEFYTTNAAAANAKQADNLFFYFARLSEARYIAGALAAKKSASGKLGYIAAENNSEINRSLNAYALGAKAVNPKAEVLVKWTGSWDAPAKERAAVRALKDLGCDIVTNHQNGTSVDEEAAALGLKSIAFNNPPADKKAVLMTIAPYWEGVYREAIKRHLSNQLEAADKHVFAGLASGAVSLADLSPSLDDKDKALLGEYSAALIAGRDIFAGELKDNAGLIQIKKGEHPDEMRLVGEMTWLVAGVKEVK